VLAVLPLFANRLRMLTQWRERESQLLLAKITVAFLITVAGGLALDKLDIKLPTEVTPVACALIIGGMAFIAVERWLKDRVEIAAISWQVVIAMALAQLLAAVFPGTSRSGATILIALVLGTSRVAATEFSFLIGIPTLLAAAAYKILKAVRHPDPTAMPENWAMLGLATVVAAIVSFFAVKWLLRYVQTHSFTGFGLYRIALGVLLLLLPFLFLTR
jgi:undecaprenyl-diphosphatase